MIITSAVTQAPARKARHVAATLVSLAAVLAGCSPEPTVDQQALENESRDISQSFVGISLRKALD